MAELFVETEHPFLQHLLAYRDSTKLKQTVVGLLKTVAEDGRIHTTYQQTVAATGRLSSLDPNLQNIPVRTESGRRIREIFIADPHVDDARLLTADYSQIEMRIMAHLSGDAALIQAFKDGEDLHSYVGSKVFGVGIDEVDSAMRSKVKAMSYGLVYGLSAYGLSRQLAIGVDEAKNLMEQYFERFGAVKDYLDEIVEQARANGYTETIMGRRRYLPALHSDRRQLRDMAERAALNAPIQGSAADIMKIAMLKVSDRLGDHESTVLLQVHDEIIVDVHPEEIDYCHADRHRGDGLSLRTRRAARRQRRHRNLLARRSALSPESVLVERGGEDDGAGHEGAAQRRPAAPGRLIGLRPFRLGHRIDREAGRDQQIHPISHRAMVLGVDGLSIGGDLDVRVRWRSRSIRPSGPLHRAHRGTSTASDGSCRERPPSTGADHTCDLGQNHLGVLDEGKGTVGGERDIEAVRSERQFFGHRRGGTSGEWRPR